VGVVVVAYRSADELAGCIDHVRRATADVGLDIVVVDNASPDDTRGAVAAVGGNVRLVEMGRNAGFAAACNAGAQASRGDYVCFVNPDARPEPGSIDALVNAAQRRPGHLLYSGRVVTPTGEVEDGCCSALPSLWEYVCFATGLSTAFPRTAWFDPARLGGWGRDDERVVPAVSGAFLLVRREEFLEAGGFDERYVMYSEDVDLSRRARESGRPPLFVPSASAVHRSGSSSSGEAKTVMVLRGKSTYLRLNWTAPARTVALWLLCIGVAVRAWTSAVSRRGTKWRTAWRERRVWTGGW